ncbi:hypothetical protein GOA63_02770 [Sinorhizobium meliloti]|nr:hypothetical protein [Sinorhizobium meliloti]MDW9437491.1 hypothetical protein [Sinorhizobium meliloti]MDW9493323.1 hypothetical protein [Sinorhizobium meliloti]MDW9542548.1 hypothetical protein [Sinorhizobium meliloti]MDW9561173.1 hypothetical protein [Sinorhizobium meliloti]
MLPPATWMPSLTPLCPMMHEAWVLVSEALLDAPLLWPTVRPTPESGLGNRHR